MDNKTLNKILPYPWTYSYLQKLNFDDSPTTYIMLARLLRKVNELVEQGNDMMSILEQLIAWVDTQLEGYAKDQLNEWLTDGTLERLINEVLLNEKQTYFDTYTSMLLSKDLVVGMLVKTYGYNVINDGGGAVYQIKEYAEPLTVLQGKISDTLMWELIPIDRKLNIKQLGITDGTDISGLLNAINTLSTVRDINLSGSYAINNTVTFSYAMKLYNGTLSINNLKYGFLIDNNIVIHDITFDCNWNSSQILRITGGNIDIYNCEFFHLDNGERTETICPIVTDNCTGKVHHNYIHDMKKTTTVPASNSCCGMSITDSVLEIHSNRIEDLHPITTEELNDYDGIILFGNSDTTLISNNKFKNISGRFIKLQSKNVKIYDNVMSNADIEILQNFRAIDFQFGQGDAQRNIISLNVQNIKSSMVINYSATTEESSLIFANNTIKGDWFYMCSANVGNAFPMSIDIKNNTCLCSFVRIGNFTGAINAFTTITYIGNTFKRLYNTFNINITGDISNYLEVVFEDNVSGQIIIEPLIPKNSSGNIPSSGNIRIANNANFNETAEITPYVTRCGNARFIFKDNASIVGAPTGFEQNVIVEGIQWLSASTSIVKLTKLSDGSSVIVGFS